MGEKKAPEKKSGDKKSPEKKPGEKKAGDKKAEKRREPGASKTKPPEFDGDGEATDLTRELLNAAARLARNKQVQALVYIADGEPAGLKYPKSKTIRVVSDKAEADRLREAGQNAVDIPTYPYTRSETVKVAMIACVSAGYLEGGDTAICVVGRHQGEDPDAIIRVEVGRPFEEQKSLFDQLGAEELDITPQVLEAAVDLALRIGHEGYEGRSVGAIIVVGDSINVQEKSRQLTLNPFQGYPESEKNILDPTVRDAMQSFAMIDGAMVVRGDGVVLAAGRLLQAGDDVEVDVPLGLGARHAAAASISASTNALAITVSQTSGSVRVFRDGKTAFDVHQDTRRG